MYGHITKLKLCTHFVNTLWCISFSKVLSLRYVYVIKTQTQIFDPTRTCL